MPGTNGKIRIPSLKEWRKRRDQAGILHYIIAGIPRGPLREQAWQVYEDWQEERITFKEAEQRLRELAAKAKAKAKV